LAVKHRQLACQVGKLADDHQKNPMASFNFEPAVLDEGTTFIFGSWVCIANGSGGFNSHLTNLMNSESFSPASPSESGEVLLLELADEIERLSVSDVTSNRSPTALLGLYPIYSEAPRNYTMYGLHNTVATYMAACITASHTRVQRKKPPPVGRRPSLILTQTQMMILLEALTKI